MSAIHPIIKSRQKRQDRYQKRFSQRLSRIAIVILILLSLIITAGIISVSLLYVSISNHLPSLETLPLVLEPENNQLPEPSRLLDKTGKQVIAILENSGAHGRDYFSVQKNLASPVSESLILATIASIEPGYWTNQNLTLNGLQNSDQPTIAQRIVRNYLLFDQPLSLQRAFLERILAGQVISRFGREKVMEWYLNSADYGNLTYGADAAARVYFGKPATKLTIAEAALLAAAAQSPSLNPIDAPIAAHERKDYILNLMFEQGLISNDQLMKALEEDIQIQPSKGFTYDVAPNFTKLVIKQASNFIRPELLYRGGYDIITTLDYELQNQVECTIATQSAWINEGTKDLILDECEMARLLPTAKVDGVGENIDFSSSVIVTDPNSGQVLSMAGEDGAGHSPGSIITPFIYLDSFTRGASPASVIWDIPANAVEGLSEVKNPDGEFHGPVSIRRALANDYVIPAIQTLSQMDPDQVWHTAMQLGINNLQVPDGNGALLLPIMGGSADLLEISQAYGVFASQGSLTGISQNSDIPQETNLPITPQVILTIQDRNGSRQLDCTKELSDCRPTRRPVITPQLAYLITNILSDETARWPSLGHPNPLEIGRPTAAKIGFTKSYEDAWTIGYTPDLVVSVWVGTKESDQEIVNSPDWAAGLWHAVIQYATKDQPVEEFLPPAGISEVQVCEASGLLPTEECPHVVEEVFLNGNEPTQRDNLFRTFPINRETGRLATIFTSPGLIDEETYMIVPPEAEDWARKEGISQVPEAYDVLESEQISSPNARITSPNMFGTIKGSVPVIGRAAGLGFDSYRIQYGSGLNPKSWLHIEEDFNEPVRNGQLGVWDTTGLSGLYALQLIVSYEDGSVETATIQVTVDNEKPKVDIQYPDDKEVLSLSQAKEITILVEASDDLELASVELLVDGELLASLQSPPFAYPWKLSSGEHLLQVRAIDRAGNIDEEKVTVLVE